MRKQTEINALCRAYSLEKRHWLTHFQAYSRTALLARPRTVRDEKIKEGYTSRYGLQARHWKLALEEAAGIWDKYWQALFVEIRKKISRHKDLSEEMRHYVYWLLRGYSQFAALMQKKLPEPPFALEKSSQSKVAAYLRRTIKRLKGKPPTVKKMRSVRFDADCYDLFEHKGHQYIKLMSLKPGKRIILPLSGKTKISGTITLVQSQKSTAIHLSYKLKKNPSPKTTLEAVDFGYTEVMTDTDGIRYGTQFGFSLTKASDDLHQKMQKRHKLHALQKKKSKNTKHLKKYNLGRKKHRAKMQRTKTTLEKEINTSINQLLKTKNPSLLVTEDLRHPFTYDKPKSVNRKLSNWIRGKLQDRIAFKALAEGFRHEQVNPAYGSQSCPHCEFVDPRNRTGDNFTCLHCGHEDIADRIAALNYARRYGDPEIERYTPYRHVKTILLSRFHRRLETGQPVTVPGRTLETALQVHPPPEPKQHKPEEGDLIYWAVNQRAKQNEHV